MKVIILAGGLGTRLGNISETIPKPMVQVGARPIIWHIMKIYSHYGFNDFILNLGYKQEEIKQYFYDYNVYANDFSINLGTKKIKILNTHDEKDWNITLIDTGLNTQKGGRLKRIEQYLDDDINLMTYGDGIADVNIKDLIKFHKTHKKILTITGVHPPSRFGEIIEKDSRITSFKEKPQVSSGMINGGFFVFNKGIFKYLSGKDDCDLEFETFEKLASANQIMVYKHLGSWDCVDTERDLKYLNKLWTEGKAFWKVWK